MKKALIHVSVIAAIASLVFSVSGAFFSDTETSSGNEFTASRLDLTINGHDNPENIVDFRDLKPGDTYTQNKSLYIDSLTSNVWMHIKDLTAGQGQQSEPETAEENGTPKYDIQNYLTYALQLDGETIIATSAATLPDFVSCWIPLGKVIGEQEAVLQQIFRFDSEVTNWAQGDTLTFTEEFYAQQFEDPQEPVSESGRVWDEEAGMCVDVNSMLFIIGDEEESQTDNPVDELNFTDLGILPNPPAIGAAFTHTITQPVDDVADKTFPWNSKYNSNYARTINIGFNYSGPDTDVRLTIGWSPGKSGSERKEVFLDSVHIGYTPIVTGSDVSGWWSNMPRRTDSFDFALTAGAHTITLKQLMGDGTLWDFVKLEKI